MKPRQDGSHSQKSRGIVKLIRCFRRDLNVAIIRWTSALWLFGLLTSCTNIQPGLVVNNREFLPSTTEELWAIDQALGERGYEEAQRRALQEIFRRLGGRLAARPLLDTARSAFEKGEYREARGLYLGFLNLFPHHPLGEEAHYFLGLSYFNEMRDVDRDQSFTRKALQHFQAVLQKPDSPYAADVRAKIVLCRRRLAEKEIYVGAFYLKRGHYNAALGRFDTVLNNYYGIGLGDQALFYKAVTLWRLKRQEEARVVFLRLQEHSGSTVAQEAAGRLCCQTFQMSQWLTEQLEPDDDLDTALDE